MPPKKRNAVAAGLGQAQPTRATKTQAATTIRNATIRNATIRNATIRNATIRNATIRNSTQPASRSAPTGPVADPAIDPAQQFRRVDEDTIVARVISAPEIQNLGERLETIQDSISNAINDKVSDMFDQIMDRMDERFDVFQAAPGTPRMNQGTSNPPGSVATDVLSRYPWVDKATFEAIANGDFDIYNLPKLHREDEPRHRNSKKTLEGVHFSLDGTNPEFIVGRTKMHNAFKDLATFLSAWWIYVSIRTSYAPERGPGLAYWSERLVFHTQKGFPWSVCLNYAIAYFQKHQNSPTESWFSVDSELVSNYFAIANVTPTAPFANTVLNRAKRSGQPTATSASNDSICFDWNRVGAGCTFPEKYGVPCPRRHVCSRCTKESHKAFNCPKPSTDQPPSIKA
jgi:hypothetical protein